MENLGTIGLSEEQADLMEAATRFCREKSPIETVRKLMETETGYDAALWKEMAGLGWLGIAIPEAYDGVGLSLAEVAPVMEAMGRSMLASPFFATTLAAQAMIAAGTEEQKKEILPQIVRGAPVTLALSEANGDWDLARVDATAETDGFDVKLAGTKRFVTDAGAATRIIASVIFEAAPTLVVIEKEQLRGQALRRETVIDETVRSYELSLDGVTVPKTALLDPAKARAALQHIDLAANLLASAEMVGACAACIDYTIDYLQTRKQFGRHIGSYQALKHPTVDAYTSYEQARSHLYAAAHSFNDQGAGEIATRMAKAASLKALSYAADRSIQFHGGFGFTYDCDAQLYRRRAAWQASQFGDEVWQRRRLAELLF
ncbi:MAG: acyl-CoA dehydrogenase family protein [Pseudomonadota bacterium]